MPADSVKEVVVTGSLFRRTNTETPSPVTTLTQDQITKQGIVTISDAIRSISADNSGTIPNAFGAGFAAGASGVALRGLTAADTLVLIDGLRTTYYPVADDGTRNFVDLNTIPLSMVDRVEVLKDGASSIYGADAVGGVVNIITKQTYQGFEGDASVGDSQHGGGFEDRFSAILGHGDIDQNGYNAYVDFEYQNDDKIAVGQRGFPFNTNDLSSIGGLNNIGGQPGLNSGSIYGSVAPGILGTPGNNLTGIQTGAFQPLRACGRGSTPSSAASSVAGLVDNYCAQNFQNYGDDQPAEIRWSADARFTKKLDGNNQAFATVYYSENKTSINAAPSQIQSGSPINTNGIALPPTLSNGALNPNNPFAASSQYALLNYAFGDIPSENTLDNHLVRGVAGVKGEELGWSYEADLTLAHSSLNTVNRGLIDFDQLQSDINTGAYSFVNPASNTAATLAALSPASTKISTSDMDSFDFHASREVYTLPGGPLSVAVGGQLRYESIKDPALNPVQADGQPQFVGQGIAETFGHHTVGAVFGEIDAPIIKALDVNFSGRYDHYSDFGGNFSPKIGLKYTPFRQLALRATYSKGFRAPSFSQNGSSASEGFVTYSPLTSAPASFVNAHGGDQYVQSYSLAEFTTGNAAIKPETSESFTFGFIYEPFRFINISVDYYHINQSGIIAQSSPSDVLQAYYAGTALPSGSSITLDNPDPAHPTAPPRVLVVEAPFVNANQLTTDGVDVDLRANFNLPYDVKMTSELNATDIFDYAFTADGTTFQYVGKQAPYILSSGAGTPKYRANWSNSFSWGPATLTGTVYYTSGIEETGPDATGDSSPITGCLYPLPTSCKIRSFTDVDLTGSYQLTPKIQIYLNVLNLFDSGPPFDPADYAGVNYNPTYAQQGIVGRYFRIGMHYKY
ncbi:MAG: TonB-dependent receptor [Caulobacteraceae bacterium]